jgi:acyl-CoA oxidase
MSNSQRRLEAVKQHISPEEEYRNAIEYAYVNLFNSLNSRIVFIISSPVISMNEERAKAAFDIRSLTYLLDGGENITLVSIKNKI